MPAADISNSLMCITNAPVRALLFLIVYFLTYYFEQRVICNNSLSVLAQTDRKLDQSLLTVYKVP